MQQVITGASAPNGETAPAIGLRTATRLCSQGTDDVKLARSGVQKLKHQKRQRILKVYKNYIHAYLSSDHHRGEEMVRSGGRLPQEHASSYRFIGCGSGDKGDVRLSPSTLVQHPNAGEGLFLVSSVGHTDTGKGLNWPKPQSLLMVLHGSARDGVGPCDARGFKGRGHGGNPLTECRGR